MTGTMVIFVRVNMISNHSQKFSLENLHISWVEAWHCQPAYLFTFFLLFFFYFFLEKV